MKKVLAIVSAAFLLASPAVAGMCPALMGQIEDAMKTTTVDEATKAKALALYEEGKAAHDAGDHGASVAKLQEALALLGA